MSGSFGSMDEGYFVSKSQILKWISSTLGKEIKSIQQLGTGSIYCQLINKSFEGKQLISGIVPNPKLEHEYVHNLKLFQRALDKLKVEKKFDILRISKCRYLDNLQTIQWLKRYLEITPTRLCSPRELPFNKVNSPRLCTSPNLNMKKFQATFSPRNFMSPKSKNRTVSGFNIVQAGSPSSKLSDMKYLLKDTEEPGQEKFKVGSQLVEKPRQEEEEIL